MMNNILITGGTGLIGMKLSELLTSKGYQVAHLTRNKQQNPKFKQFEWDIANEVIEDGALKFAHVIIHLAGAGVADKRWTAERKQTIIESRTKSADLLFKELQKEKEHTVQQFISASAIGYYGMYTGNTLLREDHKSGDDFLAEVVVKWENAADQFQSLGLPVSKLRVGVVLAKEGGALPQLAKPIKLGVGAALGSGDQYMSWVHIDDICQMFLHLLENNLNGTFNGVAPQPVTNKEMTKAVANELDKPLWLPNVPGFVMKLVLGEMAGIVLGGNKVSSEKIIDTDYVYVHPELKEAISTIYN